MRFSAWSSYPGACDLVHGVSYPGACDLVRYMELIEPIFNKSTCFIRYVSSSLNETLTEVTGDLLYQLKGKSTRIMLKQVTVSQVPVVRQVGLETQKQI